jgi:hypothetical protein
MLSLDHVILTTGDAAAALAVLVERRAPAAPVPGRHEHTAVRRA